MNIEKIFADSTQYIINVMHYQHSIKCLSILFRPCIHYTLSLTVYAQGAEESSLSSKTIQTPSYLVNCNIFHCRIPMCALKMHILQFIVC
jgi:hypothetical protein